MSSKPPNVANVVPNPDFYKKEYYFISARKRVNANILNYRGSLTYAQGIITKEYQRGSKNSVSA